MNHMKDRETKIRRRVVSASTPFTSLSGLSILAADFKQAVERVYKEEGGFQAQKADTGNFFNGKLIGTKYGITPAAYHAFYKVEPTQDTIKNLTKSQASPIYKKNYWDKIRGDEIKNNSVADLMLNYVVNSGSGMITPIEKIANATAGKKIVSESLPLTSQEVEAINKLNQKAFFDNLKKYRKDFYVNLVKKQPAKEVYLKGWLNRLNSYKFEPESGGMSKKHLFLIGGALVVIIGGIVYAVNSKNKR